jgi:hypothetical protein
MVTSAKSPPPFGPGFTDQEIQAADTMEIWHSAFTDAGEDCTEFRLFKNNQHTATKRLGGY